MHAGLRCGTRLRHRGARLLRWMHNRLCVSAIDQNQPNQHFWKKKDMAEGIARKKLELMRVQIVTQLLGQGRGGTAARRGRLGRVIVEHPKGRPHRLGRPRTVCIIQVAGACCCIVPHPPPMCCEITNYVHNGRPGNTKMKCCHDGTVQNKTNTNQMRWIYNLPSYLPLGSDAPKSRRW